MKTGLILGISVLVAACGGQTGRQAAAGQDTATIAADSGMQVRYYEGTLPTADGTPINYELELKNEEFSGDGSYDLTMIYPKADKGKDRCVRPAAGSKGQKIEKCFGLMANPMRR